MRRKKVIRLVVFIGVLTVLLCILIHKGHAKGICKGENGGGRKNVLAAGAGEDTRSEENDKHNGTGNTKGKTKGKTEGTGGKAKKGNVEIKDVSSDWRLTLVNFEHKLPADFSPELANIDKTRQIDARALPELNEMMRQMRLDGISNVWVQSAYRSVEYQENLFQREVNQYRAKGFTLKEAEAKTLETINRPGTSEHNLGLAVDFNYVRETFDKSAGFKWLVRHGAEYGFVMRYSKDKEDITHVKYEPWHWRYVGAYHAEKMNHLNLCLEEYLIYLQKNQK